MTTQEEQVAILEARRAEVAQYQTNIAIYTAIIATLPTEWPERLLPYRGAKNQHEAIADVDIADVELLSQLWYADDCAKRIRTETLEMTKSKSILLVLESSAN